MGNSIAAVKHKSISRATELAKEVLEISTISQVQAGSAHPGPHGAPEGQHQGGQDGLQGCRQGVGADGASHLWPRADPL